MDSNISSRKKDYAEQLGEVAADFLQFAANEFPDDRSYFEDHIRKNVLDLLNHVEKPRVMVYGIYNSGKSTLINALCKEEVAEMADRPMTDQISEFDRGDYTLVDSPGVDAPIEHERVTEEYLNKCHIILFVISTKGVFEDRDNYKRLAALIEKDVPFIIVLNERGYAVNPKWTEEQKRKAKFDHDQELKVIQYKVIKNLVKESGNKNIAEKYEVVILNAKKALTGIQKNRPKLYEISNITFLEKRITQILQNKESIAALFKQPVFNLNECMNEAEKRITQKISGNLSEDFSMRLHTLASKRDNMMQDLRILSRQTVNSHLEELSNSYANRNTDVFGTVMDMVCKDMERIYQSKANELKVFVERNFQFEQIHMELGSGLDFDFSGLQGSVLPESENQEAVDFDDIDSSLGADSEKGGFWDFLKSRKQREQEKYERLEREAELRNERIQYQVQEQIRKKQEARQLAESDLDELYRMLNAAVTEGMETMYHSLITQIQEIDTANKQMQENGLRQMEQLNAVRKRLIKIENRLG